MADLAHDVFLNESAQQVRRIGSFELPCNAEVAFPLFSPEGERHWVTDWDPRPVFPTKIEFVRDAVFRQGQGDDDAVWTIVQVDWRTHHAEYVRVAPDSHTAHIVVTVEALEAGRSNVVVSYTVTAFGASLEHLLKSFSEKSYAEKMLDWQRWIGAFLQRHKGALPEAIKRAP
jgi:hypothetical protein